MMKKILFLGLLLVATLVIVSCAPRGETTNREGTLAGEATTFGSQPPAGSVARGTALATKLIKAQEKITKIGRDTCGIGKDIFYGKCVETAKLARVAKTVSRTLDVCTLQPSCSSPNYELTATDCGSSGGGEGVESCYTCSIREDIRSLAECPEGWGATTELYPDGVEWYRNVFGCQNNCVSECGRPGSDSQIECINECLPFSSLEDPCPEGFTYSPGSNIPGTSINGWFFCVMPGANEGDSICNQCGSEISENNPLNGDRFCVIRT